MNKDQFQLSLLTTPLGQPGSGRLRYSAAMHFNQSGQLSDQMLEAYRIAAGSDITDIHDVLENLGLHSNIHMPVTIEAQTDPAHFVMHLLDEIDRYLSALNSPGVNEIRSGIAAARNVSIHLQDRPTQVPCVEQHLGRSLNILWDSYPALAHAIATAYPYLDWVTYDNYAPGTIGATFAAGHGYTSLIGAEAAIRAPDFDLGLFVIAPNTLYRDHCHKAPELYVPLTGPHGWRFGTDAPLLIKPAHEPIWNEPYAPHLTKVGPDPFLCIFGWPRDVDEAARVLPADDWAALETLNLEDIA